MKLLQAIAWLLGFSVVQKETTHPTATATVTLTDADYADIYRQYMEQKEKGIKFSEFWKSIISQRGWNAKTSEDALTGFTEYIKNNSSQTQQPATSNQPNDGSVIL